MDKNKKTCTKMGHRNGREWRMMLSDIIYWLNWEKNSHNAMENEVGVSEVQISDKYRKFLRGDLVEFEWEKYSSQCFDIYPQSSRFLEVTNKPSSCKLS